MKYPFAFLCAVIAGLTTQLPAETTDTKSSKPNIILILADDMDYCDLGVTSGTKTATPNIDSIAKGGMNFTNAYVTCPVCGPSRVGILTGRYQDRVGFVTNHGPKIPANFGLPSSEVLFPENLQAAGYNTAAIGKWHLGFEPDMVPNSQGFDYYFGHLHGAHDYNPGVEDPGPILRNSTVIKTTKYLTREFGDEGAKFIRDSKAPYFLYVPFNAVHSPLQAPEETLKKFSHLPNDYDRKMAAMLYEMDMAVGEILKAAREKDNLHNTIVIFTNDNGGVRGNLPESNGVLRGGKAQVYEGGIRVPFMIQWNGHIKPGSVFEGMTSTMDLAPTLLAAADATTTSSFDGVNILPVLEGKQTAAPHKELFWHFVDAPSQRAVRKGNWKLVQEKDDAPYELYNLGTDIGETKNVAAQHPKIVKNLTADWENWNSKNVAPLWTDIRILNRRKEQSENKGQAPAGKKARRAKGKQQRAPEMPD